MKLAYLILAIAVPVSACGGNVVPGSSGGTTGAGGATGTATGTATTTATTGTGGSSGGPCPAEVPSGGPCSPQGLRCTYGDSVRADCRMSVACVGGTWMGESGACAMTTVCNQFKSPPAGQTCDATGGVEWCTFGDTLCGCGQCLEGPCMTNPAQWACSGPPTTPGCPALLPNSGAPCTSSGLECSYGYPCGGSGAVAACQNGFWAWQTIECPA